jgi:hypothetical protein
MDDKNNFTLTATGGQVDWVKVSACPNLVLLSSRLVTPRMDEYTERNCVSLISRRLQKLALSSSLTRRA